MAIHRQTYIKGLDKDTSKTKFRESSYFDARNIKVITQDGLSTGSIENEKGTIAAFEIPNTENIYRFKRTLNTAAAAGETITINGNVVSYVAGDAVLDSGDIFDILEGDASIQTAIANNQYQLSQNADYVFITGLDSPVTVSVAGTDITVELIVPAQEDLKIIGIGTIRETIVVLTTNEDAVKPASSYGQVWKLNYDEYTNDVIGLSGGKLVPSTHLSYNNETNFSTAHRAEIVGRYENIDTSRIYWVDDNNPLRSLNISNPDNFIIPPGDLDIVSNVSLSKPIIQSVGTGDIPSASVVQYAYRLLSQDAGVQTIFSPASQLLTLTEADPTSAVYNGPYLSGSEFRGSTGTGNAGSSVTYTISDVDLNYDVIEHFYIMWESADVARVVKFNEDFITDDVDITVTHSGSEDELEITVEEFNLLNLAFVAKTLTSKDDLLIAANIKENQFDIEFDARAYRSKATNPVFDLFDRNGGSEPFHSGNWDTIDEEHDAINPFNDDNPETNSDWATADQYNCIPGTSDLGGKGPNVEYSFTTFQTAGNFQVDEGAGINRPYVSINRWGAIDSPVTLGETNLDGEDIEYPINGEFKNLASPIMNGLYKGYSRGEVYRFGITFYDLKGNPSYVKWIGDIKFPEAYDGFPLMSTSGGVQYLNQLGIEFNVDVSSIQSEISGYSIVRMERTESEKSRLGTGIMSLFESTGEGGDTTYRNWGNSPLGNGNAQDSKVDNEIEIDGSNSRVLHLMDRPGFSGDYSHATKSTISTGDGFHQRVPAHKALAIFHSPLGQFRRYNDYKSKAKDYVKTLGYYNAKCVTYVNDTSDISTAFFYRMSSWGLPSSGTTKFPDGHQILKVNYEKQLADGEAISTTHPSVSGIGVVTDYDYIVNTSYSKFKKTNEDSLLGIGSQKQFMVFDDDGSSWWDAASEHWYYTGDASSGTPGTQNPVWNGGNYASDNLLRWKEVGYNRFIKNQYGGNTYLNRGSKTYISTNHFQAVSPSYLPVGAVKVFGGDTHVVYYDEESITQYWNKDLVPSNLPEVGDSKTSVALAYPCESSVNTELRIGQHWASDRDSGDMSNIQFHDHKVAKIYNQENNAREQFISKDPLASEFEEHSHEIRVSQPKIDGELLDNWKTFLTNDTLEVEGIHGEITKITNLRGNVYFYQESAVGIVAINERVTQTSDSGTEVLLGTGGVLSNYNYLSTETGTIHQFSVVNSGSSLYHFDERIKKFFRISGEGAQPVSDVKGLSAFMADIDGHLEDNDKTLGRLSGRGVHGVYDPRHNRIIMTFLEHKKYGDILPNTSYAVGDIVNDGENYYAVDRAFVTGNAPDTAATNTNVQPLVNSDGVSTFINGFTISFNEAIGAFESFLDYMPRIYANVGRRVISENPWTVGGDVFEHNKGEYGNFYGKFYDSEITLLLNPQADMIKVFDNIEYNAEVSIDDIDQSNVGIDTMHFWNAFQDTTELPLVVGENVKRKMRKWRSQIPRDITDPTARPLPRMRDAHIFLKLKFENLDDRRLVLHDMILHFRPANI